MGKIIGVVPLYDEEKESIWMLPGYMKILEACGGVPIILPLTTDLDELLRCYELCDGFLMTGGHDVDPALYGEEKLPECGELCRERDIMEKILFDKAFADDKPVLGICRGVQLMNVLLGGTLYQDLPSQRASSIGHSMPEPPYNRTAHFVNVPEGTWLADVIGAGQHGVNSLHHQAIKDAAPGAQVCAIAEDGLAEAIYMPGKRLIAGVQWHPEFYAPEHEDSYRIVQALVDACGN